ncbi:MAG: leucine-rich repeat protein [Lachnospiraceae bacterium]|jgi:hypothetical protein|nr:leucine-rich repeat protein [Lachnospiraceae bacterium]
MKIKQSGKLKMVFKGILIISLVSVGIVFNFMLPKNSIKAGSVVKDGYEFNADTGNLLIKTTAGLNDYVSDSSFVPSDVTSVSFADDMTKTPNLSGSYGYFDQCNVSSVNLNNVTVIGDYTFLNCKITSVDLSKVTSIGRSAFKNNLMEEVTFPDNLNLMTMAFQGCKYLHIANNVPWGSNDGVFYGCAFDCSDMDQKSMSMYAYSSEIPKLFYSLDKTSETISAGEKVVPPTPIFKTETGKDFVELYYNPPSWLSLNANIPKVTESGDTLSNKPGVYHRTYTISDSVYADTHTMEFTLTVTGEDTPVTGDASLSVKEATFDKNTSIADDISTVLDSAGYSLINIRDDKNYTLVANSDYTVSDSQYAFDKSYFMKRDAGDKCVLTFNMSGGTNPTLTIHVIDTSTNDKVDGVIDPKEAIFNKVSGSEDNKNIEVNLNPGDYTLSSITDGEGITLIKGTDYTVSGDKYSFLIKYFEKYEPGENCQIQFDMSGGISPILDVSIIETREVNGSVLPVTAVYDKNPKGKYHKSIFATLDLVTYDLLEIKNGDYSLKSDVDYIFQSSKELSLARSNGNAIYEIKNTFLDTLKKGNNDLVFDLSGGEDPKVTVTVMDTTSRDNNDNSNNNKNNDDKKDNDNSSGKLSSVIGSNVPIKTGDTANTGYLIFLLFGSIVLIGIEFIYLLLHKDKNKDQS